MATPAVDVDGALLADRRVNGIEDVAHHPWTGDAEVLNREPGERDLHSLLVSQLMQQRLIRNECLSAPRLLVGLLKTHDGSDACLQQSGKLLPGLGRILVTWVTA